MEQENSYSTIKSNKTLQILFYSFFILIIFSLGYIFRYYFWPFLFALIFYLPLRPIADKISKKIKNRSLSSTLVILFLFILILVPTFFLLTALADQTYQLYLFVQQKFKTGLADEILSNHLVQNIFNYFNLKETEMVKETSELLQKTSGTFFSKITALLSFPISFIINFLFMLLMLFFLLKDGYKLDESIYKVFPFPEDLQQKIFNRLKEVIGILLAGNFFIMLAQGFMIGLGFYLAGINMPLLWGSLAAILSLIPVIGTSLLWLPAFLYLLLIKSYFWAAFVGIWSLFWYLVLENILKPKIFGEKLHFHPLLFFFLLIGSLQTFNIPGVLLGPILLTLCFSFWEIYKLVQKYN